MVAIMWVWLFLYGARRSKAEHVPAVGTSADALGGIILFNFALAYTLPSWICEKKPAVPAMRMILIALVLALVFFIMIGLFAGRAFAPYSNRGIVLPDHVHKDVPAIQVSAFWMIQAFTILSNLTTIPIYAILMRYNLQQGLSMGRVLATILSILVPFTLSVLLYADVGFKPVVTLAGPIGALVNFVAPSLFFLCALQQLAGYSGIQFKLP